MLIRIGVILLIAGLLGSPAAALLFTGQASAQTGSKISGDNDTPSPQVSRKAGKDASFCKGSMEGRWRMTGGAIMLDGTVHIKASGRVETEKEFVNLFSSDLFGASKTKGGRLSLNDPIYEEGEKNRCWLSGCIKLQRGHSVCVVQMFSVAGAAFYQGWGSIDGMPTVMMMSRY